MAFTIENRTPSFSVPDYVVLSLMLLLSVAIGIYHALTGGKQSTSSEYLMGNRRLPMVPVAISLVASYMSGITYLGVPTDVYFNGTMFLWFALCHIFSCIIIGRTFLPVFYRIGLTSVYEYLELRFNKVVRRCALISFYSFTMLYLGIVIYAPCLAFSAVTGLSFVGSILAVGIVCIFYTTLGGMKAVVWADVFQMTVALMGFVAVIAKGSLDNDGFQGIWNISSQGQRIEFFNFDPDPTVRHSVWSVVIGGTFLWTSVHGLTQYQVQRFLSCKSMQSCYGALVIYAIGLVVITFLSCMCGLVAYAYYHDCDPLRDGDISRPDQILPYLVVDIFGSTPGLPGLFLSAVFSAALSTLSSALNGLAAVTGEDIVKPIWPDISEKRYTLTIKCLAVFFGLLVIGLAFLADVLGKVIQTAISITGVFGGPTMAMFSLGMFCPRANSKGTIVGFFSGIAIGLWISIGSLVYPPASRPLPVSIDNCAQSQHIINVTELSTNYMTTEIHEVIYNVTQMDDVESTRPAIASMYSISYAWYTMVTFLTATLIGIIGSFITGPTPPPDDSLLSPLCESFRCCFPSRWACKTPNDREGKKSAIDNNLSGAHHDTGVIWPLNPDSTDLQQTKM